MKFIPEFDTERCSLCGECFHQCPAMGLSLAEAKEEIKRLVNGEDTRRVLKECESCFACDYICPEGARPASLILQRWHEAYEREGLLPRANYFLPLHVPNFRTYVIDRLPADEKAMLDEWRAESPAERIFYPGCNWITAPYLARTSLLEDFTIRGSLSVCCGEMYFRMGLYDQMRQLAKRLEAWLERMGTRRMVMPCTAGANIFQNVLPEFGFDYDLEVEHLLPVLMRRIENNEIEVKNRLDMTVTIQDSCHAKFLGEDFMDLPRKLLSRLGIKVVEEKRSRESMLCCGIGGGFSHPSSYNPLRLTRSTWRSLAEAKATRADAIVTYCAGCAQMLATGQVANPANQMDIYHIIELIGLATGEAPMPRKEKMKRAARFLFGVARHQTPSLISFARGRLSDIPVSDDKKKY